MCASRARPQAHDAASRVRYEMKFSKTVRACQTSI